jgi:enoyl-CoA hydratase/carnithine racemase
LIRESINIRVFDDVFIPDDRVFLKGESQYAGQFVYMFANYHRASADAFKSMKRRKTMEFKTLIVVKKGHIGTLMFNRPEALNAIDVTMFEELPRAIHQLNDDNTVRVVIVTGAGRGFCSGADVKTAFASKEELEERDPEGDALPILFQGGRIEAPGLLLGDMHKATIAAVNGPAIGGGLDLAMACDFRIASEKAVFSERYGMFANTPDIGGTYRLAKLVGIAKAKELTFLADIIDAQEAFRIGLVNKVVPHEQLMEATGELAGRLAKCSPVAVAAAKFLIDRNQDSDQWTAIEREMLVARFVHRTTDPYEGIVAFREKREPKYEAKVLGHERKK